MKTKLNDIGRQLIWDRMMRQNFRKTEREEEKIYAAAATFVKASVFGCCCYGQIDLESGVLFRLAHEKLTVQLLATYKALSYKL